MTAPCDHGRLRVVVVRVIILRHMDGKSGVFIAQIFRLQRPRVVFRMAGDEDLPAALGRHGVDPGLLGRGEDFQLAAALDILAADARVPRVGHHEHIVESAHEHGRAPLDHMRVDAEELFGQIGLPDAVVIIKPRLRAPADVERAVHVRPAPFHDAAQLRPVFDLLKRHLLHGCAGDDQPVEPAILHVLERLIEFQQMLAGRVFGFVAVRVDQLQLHLQRRVAEQPRQLRLCGDFGGHEIQNENLQRADVLRDGPRLVHDENILVRQRFRRRQTVRDHNGHGVDSFLRLLQRLIEIGDQILRVLQAAGIADQILADACGQQLLGVHLPVRGGSRVQAAGVRVGHVRLDGCDLEPSHDGLGCGPSAFYAEAHDAARAVRQVFLPQFIIFVARQAAVLHPRDVFMLL